MLLVCKSCIVNISGKLNGVCWCVIFVVFWIVIVVDCYVDIDFSLIFSVLCYFSNNCFVDGGMFGKIVVLYV